MTQVCKLVVSALLKSLPDTEDNSKTCTMKKTKHFFTG